MAEKQKMYRVLNPRNIPTGVHIISFQKGEWLVRWYEGDVIFLPDGIDTGGRLIREGYLEEVEDG